MLCNCAEGLHFSAFHLLVSAVFINPWHACTARVTVVVLCVHVSVYPHSNLWTGTSRCQTEGTSTTSGLHALNVKRLKMLGLETTASRACNDKRLPFYISAILHIRNVYVVIFHYTWVAHAIACT